MSIEVDYGYYEKSQELDDAIGKILAEQGKDAVLAYLSDKGVEWLDKDNFIILCIINEMTKKSISEDRKQQLIDSLLKRNHFIKSVKIVVNPIFNVDELVIETVEGIIRVCKFSEVAPEIVEVLPFIETDDRVRQCFQMAFMIIRGIKGNSSKIVTSHVYGYTNLSMYLHSYVEAISEDGEWVIDGTLNAMINKDGYERLRKPDVLTEIAFSELESDIRDCLADKKIELVSYYLNRQAFLENLGNFPKK